MISTISTISTVSTNEDINVGIRLAQYSKILMLGITDRTVRNKLPVLEYCVVNNHYRIRGIDGNEIIDEFTFDNDNTVRDGGEVYRSMIQYASTTNVFGYYSYNSSRPNSVEKIELFDVHNEAEVFQKSLVLSSDLMKYCGLYWGLREITKTNTGAEYNFNVITISERELLRYVHSYGSVLEELRVDLYE